MRKGQHFNQPCLGTREFGANYEIIENREDIPKSQLFGIRDLGYMLHSLNYRVDEKDKQSVNPSFFRVILNDGILDLTKGIEVVS